MHRARILALTAALALGVPAGAVAQSPGDAQYADPLAGSDSAQGGSGGGGSGSAGGQSPRSSGSGSGLQSSPPAGTDGTTAQADGAGAAAADGTAGPSATAEGRSRLPDTGAELWLLGLAGGGLLLAGGALHVRAAR